jgi:acyl-CoA dehydrogenase
MEFGLSSEQRMLIETVRQFIAKELKPLEQQVEDDGRLDDDVARSIMTKSTALGLYGMNVPERWGGAGLSCIDRMLVEEQFGRTTDILIRRAFGNVYEVLWGATDLQIERWLKPSAAGERTGSICITEPGAGSDAASIRTKATPNEHGWVLNGMKHFISDAHWADYFIVSAVTDPTARHRGISLFLVDKSQSGVTVGRDQPMMGIRGTSHCEVFFDGVQLTSDNLLGAEGSGFGQILGTLNQVRLAQVGARMVGKSAMITELMIKQATDREQFGKPIGEFQMIQQMIADSVIEVNAARMLVLRAAWEIDQGRDGRDLIAMVKVHAAETVNRVADRAVQVFGGMGYCKDLSIERYYRDARISRVYDGASEIHRMVIAKDAMKHGSALFDTLAF